jgi:hypothetical protein
MISRRSLFGLALVPLAPSPSNPMLDLTECLYFKPQPPRVYDDKDFANCTDIYETMRRIKLHMIEQLRTIRWHAPDAPEL